MFTVLNHFQQLSTVFNSFQPFSGLLSVHAERVSVSCMRDFFLLMQLTYNKLIKWERYNFVTPFRCNIGHVRSLYGFVEFLLTYIILLLFLYWSSEGETQGQQKQRNHPQHTVNSNNDTDTDTDNLASLYPAYLWLFLEYYSSWWILLVRFRKRLITETVT